MHIQITKNQHYISRSHLIPWADKDGLLHIVDKEKNTNYNANPSKVFVKKYLYGLKQISDKEKLILLQRFSAKRQRELLSAHPISSSYDRNLFYPTIYYIQNINNYSKPYLALLDGLLYLCSNLNEILTDNSYAEEKLIKEGLENIHTLIENYGNKFKNKILSNGELLNNTFFRDFSDQSNFIYYLSVQVYRTYLQKSKFISDKNIISGIDNNNIWPIAHIILGAIFNDYILDHYYITIITNNSHNGFILGDSLIDAVPPIEKELNSSFKAEWIYTISPRKAIKICFDCSKTILELPFMQNAVINDDNEINLINQRIDQLSTIIILPP